MKKKPFVKWRVDCGSLGVQETWARSAAEAMNHIRWRLHNLGIFSDADYFGEPKKEEVKSKSEEVRNWSTCASLRDVKND